MGVYADHFIAEAEGRTIEVLARQTLLGSGVYTLLIDGGIGDTVTISFWGLLRLVFGKDRCELRAMRRGWSTEERRSEAVMARAEAVKGFGGVAEAPAPYRPRSVEPAAAAEVCVTVSVLQGFFRTGVRLEVNGVPVAMRRLL